MDILVTRGTGYIGSHMCVALLEAVFSVIVVDNLTNSKEEVINRMTEITGKKVFFYKEDITNKKGMEKIFEKHKIDGVIHLAGLKVVSESIEKPLQYYQNNVVGALNLLHVCDKYRVNKFVFSSSAAVYGDKESPLKEEMELFLVKNPYGETKRISERIFSDYAKTNGEFALVILRYFNPVGAHESGLIGETPTSIPNNLMPNITQVARGELPRLKVFGNNSPTVDGTGVRDYIHVVDLAEGHVEALKSLKPGVKVYNLETGKGTSVLELVNAFEKVNQVRIPYEFIARRPGDITEAYADVTKVNRELG